MKKIITFLAFIFLLSFFVSSIYATETRRWGFEWEGFNVDIYAPYQAYPDDIMTIRVRVESRSEEVQSVTIFLKIYGSKDQGLRSWYTFVDALDNVDLSLGASEDQYFNVSIPDDVDPGLVYSETSVSWKIWRESAWQEQSRYGVFKVTYLRNKPYEDLQVAYNQLLANYNSLLSSYDQLLVDYNSLQTSYNDLENSYNDLYANYSARLMDYDELLADYDNLQTNYDSLNSTYYSLLSDYSSLQTSFNELKSKYEFGGEIASTLNLMYVFIETTVIFIATTIYFARARIYSALRKSKQQT